MIKVSATAMANLEQMQRTLAGISRELDALSTQLNTLESGWTGEAREAYALAQRQWNANMARLSAVAVSARGRAVRHVEDVGTFDTRRSSAWTR